jgi:putative hemolysin
MSITTGLLIVFVCIVIEAFFSSSEIAMVHADRLALQRKADDGDHGAERALGLLAEEDALLGTCLIGTNIAVVTGASTFALMLADQGMEGVWLTPLLYTPVVLIFGEALPKTVLQHYATDAAPVVAYPLSAARTLFRPFLMLVRLWSRVLSALVGAATDTEVTRAELLQLLEDEAPGPIHDEERRLIRGVLALSDITVGECMTPLVQVVAVSSTATIGVAADTAVRTQHSRLPIFERRIDNIVGMVHQADLLFLSDDAAPIAAHLRPVRFVPDAKRADDLFREMRELGEHFAVVVDEFGGCIGIVTLEDVLEELVGDIKDERDVIRPSMVPRADGSWHVPGNTEIEDAEDTLGVELPEGDYETMAGLVLAHLGHIPVAGEELVLDNVRIRVEEATDRAIRLITVRVEVEQAAAS